MLPSFSGYESDLVKLKVVIQINLIIIMMLSYPALSQGKKEIIYGGTPSDKKVLEQYSLPKFFFDSIASKRSFNELVNVIQKDGYLLAGVDTVLMDSTTVIAQITVGEKYRWASLKPGNLEETILTSIGYRDRFYENKPFKYEEVSRILKRIITYMENNGFPFASVKLDSITIDQHHISASLNADTGPFIIFDTVALDGESKTKPLFLSNYLRIKPGAPYEEKKVAQANAKLKRLPYLKVIEAPFVTFQLKQGTPHFKLADIKANQVDGIIGLLPNEGVGGKPLITGQFDILLQNLFGTGKGLSLNWQRTQINSQNLRIRYDHPNVFKSPVNIKAGFSLLKEDTLFINRNLSLSLSLLAGKYSSIRVFTDIKVARKIANTPNENAGQAFQYADFNLNQYGVGYDYSNLDNPLLPTRGLIFDLETSVGNKTITGENGAALDSVEVSDVQYNFSASAHYYFPVTNRFVIKSRILAGSVVSDRLFYNDLYRIGGLATLRGFVENEFFVSDFAVGSLEGQYFLDNESYMFLFYDQGYIFADIDRKIEDYPAGLGAGLTFTTNAGAFSFVYALGRTSNQSFNINFSKIHFGYITRF